MLAAAIDSGITVVYTLGMKTVLNVKTDKEVKEEAQRVAKELGLPLSTVVNAYLKEFVRNRAIHLSAAPRMSKALEEVLGGVERDLKAEKNLSPRFHTAGEAIRYLNGL